MILEGVVSSDPVQEGIVVRFLFETRDRIFQVSTRDLISQCVLRYLKTATPVRIRGYIEAEPTPDDTGYFEAVSIDFLTKSNRTENYK